jgi:hypothetical protein
MKGCSCQAESAFSGSEVSYSRETLKGRDWQNLPRSNSVPTKHSLLHVEKE